MRIWARNIKLATMRHIPTRPDTDPIVAFREPDHPQRMAVEQCPAGAAFQSSASIRQPIPIHLSASRNGKNGPRAKPSG